MRRGVLSAAKYYEVRFISRDVLLCLRAAADGRICHVQRLRGRAVRDAFCLWQNATRFRQVWRGGVFGWGGVGRTERDAMFSV